MAKRLKWYIVTSARSQAVSLPGNDAKLMPRGSRFQSDEKSVRALLRRKVIRELQDREVPLNLRGMKPATKEEKEDMILIVDMPKG